MKIGIFGGCFNPPHQMHYKIGQQLLEKKYLDKLIYVPTGNSYEKRGLIDAKERYQMLKLMIQHDANMKVSDYEFSKKTYTYQTLNYFQKIYPNDEIFFICGYDNLIELDTWKNYKSILENFKIIVMKRGSYIPSILEKYQQYHENIIEASISLESLSSTKIRDILKNRNYDELKDKINSDVLRYIRKRNLY